MFRAVLVSESNLERVASSESVSIPLETIIVPVFSLIC